MAALVAGALPASGGGAEPANRIVGGAPAPPGAFEYAGAVVISGGPPQADRRRQVCTATLVAPQVAITAAHCFLDIELVGPLPFISPDRLTFVFGKRVLGSPAPGQRATGAHVFIPSTFRTSGSPSLGDYAVVHLDRPIAAPTAPLLPAGANEAPLYAATAGFAGWGLRRPFTRKTANALRQGSGNIVPISKCGIPKFIKRDNAFLCLSGRSVGGICSGDSGGPLVAGSNLVGVTNYATFGCSRRGARQGFANMLPSGPNWGWATAAVSTIDTTPPKVTVTRPLPNPMPRGSGEFPFAFSFDEPVRAICTRGRRAVACARGLGGEVTVTPGPNPGRGVIRIIALDQWFNRTQVDYAFNVG